MSEELLGAAMLRLARAEGHKPASFKRDYSKTQNGVQSRADTLLRHIAKEGGCVSIGKMQWRMNATREDFNERLAHLVETGAVVIADGKVRLV